MKRRGRADEVLAAVSAPAFQRKLAEAIKARGSASIDGHGIRELALKLLSPGALDGVRVSFQWDKDKRKVSALVKGSSAPVDEQAGGRA